MLSNLPQNTNPDPAPDNREDDFLFGWDPTPGIVSVRADRGGQADIWQREGDKVIHTRTSFRPWLLANSLDDLAYLGSKVQPEQATTQDYPLITYRDLEGPEKTSYRYQLSARNLRNLEQAILSGASKRLQRPIQGFDELGNAYYRVGPVEQYLMLTGRVYFRGLSYNDLHRLQFDLETTALDPHRGRIFMVAVRDSRGLALTLDAPRPEDEANLIKDLCKLIRERDPDIIENHNLFGFDLPFLEERASKLNIPLALGRNGGSPLLERREETLAIGPEARRRVRYSLGGRELIDTLDAVRRHDFVVRDMPSHSLKDVARYFGMASTDRTYIEGAKIFETYGLDPERVRRYALDDVAEVDGLSRRLLGAPFALAGMAPRRYERLASAGPAMGILEPLLIRAYLRSNAAPPCQDPKALGSGSDVLHEGGAVHLFAEGIAEHVVKADVASLYPSLMRTFQIGPACDRLGMLLKILARLTDLRLVHKAKVRTVEQGSVEESYHNATQAAMKILINAAYGYMGAGSMAMFADNRAASEVTRRGRAILKQVLDSLQQRGMALIEADTDGVYFAVPSDWSEEQERALVAEIGAELPSGIRLEYEGRYRAMLSHEVKNYALLTYSGQLIIHGVALRSSRAEPFGERFLRQVLPAAMQGDVVGVHQTYLETVRMIQTRSLPATDMGTRVRLSKTPETYLAAQGSHPEAQYEALLKAGRKHWYPGERVRFYRTPNKQYVWLPEESESESLTEQNWEANNPQAAETSPAMIANRRDYDSDHYLQVLITSYAARLRKAFEPADFEQLFRLQGQQGLFDQPIESIQPRWIRCTAPGTNHNPTDLSKI